MAKVFWNAKEVLLIGYLEKAKSKWGVLRISIGHTKGINRGKRPGMEVLFQYENAPDHSSRVTEQKLTNLRFDLIPHSAYPPDLGPLTSICPWN